MTQMPGALALERKSEEAEKEETPDPSIQRLGAATGLRANGLIGESRLDLAVEFPRDCGSFRVADDEPGLKL
jgi:hypothetical protein